ncbi:MAG: septum formation initiator family protein [Clostridium sp.]|jgi:cell division protein FtsB|nr:septum formation initiator family protein [Clostridium sp.]
MRQERAQYQKNRTNRLSIFLISVIVLLIFAVVFYGRKDLQGKIAARTAEQEALEERYADLQQEAKEIDEYRTYTQTMKFVEETAKNKLGLVYEDEIIIREAK